MSFVLASASPRRRELLEKIGMEFEVLPALGPEEAPPGLPPSALAVGLALQKAKEAAAARPHDVIIAADTIVALGGAVLGKPRDRADAIGMLSRLSGREHEVYTGVAVIKAQKTETAAERTLVRFRPLTRGEIEAYVDTGEPMDKAGAYGAQGIGSLFIEGIEGDFFNVMGLPLCRLQAMLKRLGVELL